MNLWQALTRWRRKNPSSNTLAGLTAKFEAEIAQRRTIEHELAHLASFAELDPNIVFETNLDGHVLYQNIVALEQFGELSDAPEGHALLEGLRSLPEALRREKKTLHSRSVKYGERTFNQLITLVENGTRLRSYVTDVTELKRLDELKTDFVNMVSHELRTPLTSLQAVVRMLHAEILGPLNDDQKVSLGMAVSSIDRLGRLINNLLDVSKMESGKMEMHRQWVDVNNLLQEVCTNFTPFAKERGLDIHVDIKQPLPLLYLDRDKIVQVLTNLVQNAMKFTPKGFVAISAEVDHDTWTCTIADSGPGIPAAALSKLFGKFQQVGSHSVSTEKGTGLGLSVCKGLVELHGGTIWVESQEGQGARFIFRLPRLNPGMLFEESVRQLVQDAAVTSRPLSVVIFSWENWEAIARQIGAPAADALMERLEALVKSECRQEIDPVMRSGGQVWMAATNVNAGAAGIIAERVNQAVELPLFQTTAGAPVKLAYHVTAYPEHTTAPEKLLAGIQQAPT